jgi:type IV pilus assembly protein PilM
MDQSLVVQGIQEAMAKAGVTAKNVVTAVSGRAVIVKKVVMDKMNPDDAKEAIFWEAEQHVPFDIDDVCLDFQVLNEDVGANQMEILLVAAKKEMVNAHAALVREAGLNPIVTTWTPSPSRTRWSERRNTAGRVGLINIGPTSPTSTSSRTTFRTSRATRVGSNVSPKPCSATRVTFEEAENMLGRAGRRRREVPQHHRQRGVGHPMGTSE